jgi:hypothetical protein
MASSNAQLDPMYQEITAASPERARVPARPQRTQARRLPQRIEAPVFNDSHRNLNVAKLRNIEIAPVGLAAACCEGSQRCLPSERGSPRSATDFTDNGETGELSEA